MKKLIVALCALLTATAAFAADHATGFVSGTYTSLGTGWTQGSGKLVGANVEAAFVKKTDATIVKGRKYRWSVTVANSTGGDLQVVVGRVASSLSGSVISAPTTGQGLAAIASNFDVSATLLSGGGAPESPDPESAFRFVTGPVKYAQDDPLLYNGYPGAAHLHEFYCNAGVNAYSTFQSLRTSGDSFCGKANRSSYWAPAMLNGKNQVVVPIYGNVYYKGFKSGYTACQAAPDATHVGICVKLPNGLRFVFGHNMAAPTSSGLMSSNPIEVGSLRYECRQEGDENTPVVGQTPQTSIDALVDAGCPAGSIIFQQLEAPYCWNGTQLDSADHRSHMAYPDTANGTRSLAWTYGGVAQTPATGARCPSTHPYVIPHYSLYRFFKTKGDPTFIQKKWHLSSDDQMSPRMEGGMTSHADVFFAWDQAILDQWHSYCTEGHLSCSAGVISATQSLFASRGATSLTRGSHNGMVVSMSRFGWSGPIMGNGTFSGEFTAIDSGQLAIGGFHQFSGEVTAFSLLDVTASNNSTSKTLSGSRP